MLPSVKEVVEQYLYGSAGVPSNKLEAQIRPPLAPETYGATIAVDRAEYMSSGGGRFARGAQFEIVQEFFDSSNILAAGDYTVAQIKSLLFLGSTSNQLIITQHSYRDGVDDYAERTAIYETTSFLINQDAIFKVSSTGVRSIENFSVRPFDDNVDFNGGSLLDTLLNPTVGDAIDPYNLGRTVEIEFAGDITTSTYTAATLAAENILITSWSGADLIKLNSDIADIALDLWNDGVTKFLDSANRPILYGTTGADTINGSSINGSTWADANGVPTIDDAAYETNGTVLIGVAGNDTLTGATYTDSLLGGSGNDSVNGGAGNDTLQGGSGNDTLSGGNDNDLLQGGSGTDSLSGGTGNDSLYGGTDADTLLGGDGNDLLVGGAGNDSIGGEGGDDTIVAGDGTDTIDGGSGKDAVSYQNATSGINTTTGSLTGVEAIIATNYADTISGDSADNIISGLNGNDSLSGSGGADSVLGGGGNDTLKGGDGADLLEGGTGTDIIYSNTDATNSTSGDTLYGGAGNDTLYGGGTGSTIYGGEGTDSIHARGTDGIHKLYGGAGNDTYFFKSDVATSIWGGSYQITIDDSDGNFIIDFEGIVFDRLESAGDGGFYLYLPLALEPSHYLFEDGNKFRVTEALSITNFAGSLGDSHMSITPQGDLAFNYTAANTTSGAANESGFTYEVPLEAESAEDEAVDGTSGNDTLSGGSGNNAISGGAGNDSIDAGSGADTIDGGSGADTINAGAGIDVLTYAVSTAAVIVNLGNGYAAGGDAAGDVISNVEYMIGSAYADNFRGDSAGNRLEGGVDNDTLVGGTDDVATTLEGADTGNDIIYGGLGNDYVEGKDGSDWVYGEDGNDTVIGGTGGDSVYGGAGADYISGQDGDDRLYAMVGGNGTNNTGNDTIYGGNGDDNVTGSGGFDYVNGESGDDYVDGKDGNDTVYGGSGSDQVYGGNGNDTIYGGADGDYVSGQSDDDVIAGEGGVDTISGGLGNDTFQYAVSLVDTVDTNVDVITDAFAGTDVFDFSDLSNSTLRGTGSSFGMGNGSASQSLTANAGIYVMTNAVASFGEADVYTALSGIADDLLAGDKIYVAFSNGTDARLALITETANAGSLTAADDTLQFVARLTGVAHTELAALSAANFMDFV